jgi:hypothetical protein
MRKPVITIENLGKRYAIGHRRDGYDGLRHSMEAALRAPLGWFRSQRQRKLTQKDFWAVMSSGSSVAMGRVRAHF